MNNKKGKIRKHLLSPKLIDEIMNSKGENGQANIAIRKYNTTIATDTDKIYIGTDMFSDKTDVLLVFKNSIYLENEVDYTFNSSDKTISRVNGHNWEASEDSPTIFFFICILNVPSAEVKFDGTKILDNSISELQLSNELRQKLNKETNVRIEDNSITEDKLDQALKTKLNNSTEHVNKFIHDYTLEDWSNTANSDELYTITVNHNLNNEDIIVTGISKNTKRNIALSYRIIDNNNIEIELNEKTNLRLICCSL